MSASIDLSIAVGAISGEAVVTSMIAEARSHRCVKHPYLHALVHGTSPDPAAAVRNFLHQYHALQQEHAACVTEGIAQLSNERHRSALEGLRFTPARTSAWQRLLTEVGLTETWLLRHPAPEETRIWAQLLLQTCASSPAPQAVGALGLGIETIRPLVYAQLKAAIATHLEVADDVLSYFDISTESAPWEMVAADLALMPIYRAQLRTGMMMVLQLMAAFFDMLERHADPTSVPG